MLIKIRSKDKRLCRLSISIRHSWTRIASDFFCGIALLWQSIFAGGEIHLVDTDTTADLSSRQKAALDVPPDSALGYLPAHSHVLDAEPAW